MNQNEEIIKEARKFADDLCKNLNKFNAQQDGSCHICGSRPQTFVDYLEKVLKESDQQWLDKIKRAMPEWERSNKAILLFIANLQAEGIDCFDKNIWKDALSHLIISRPVHRL